MEVQLEEEYEDKQKVLRERRELECKMLNIQDKVLPLLFSLLCNPWAQACIHMRRLSKCVPLTADWLLLFSAHMRHRS